MSNTCIVWLRNDLRTTDNPALFNATKDFDSVIPVYIHDSKFSQEHAIGSASKWWLHHSLEKLKEKTPLITRCGDTIKELKRIISEAGAKNLYINKSFNPNYIKLDNILSNELNIEVSNFDANLLTEPEKVLNGSGSPFKVFTPFWKHCIKDMSKFKLCPEAKASNTLDLKSDELKLLPTNPDWAEGFRKKWKCGQDSALDLFHSFFKNKITEYKEGRNFPSKHLTSELSPRLAFGEISVRYIYNYIQDHITEKTSDSDKKNISHFISELGWREFSYNLLYNFPRIINQNFKENFNDFGWDKNPAHSNAWKKGLTGYPIVDAGMRELWHTGYMHNRTRMIVGSFLVKDLHIDWREGEQWFWDTLVDADIASNTASWQWVAGSGADAAPYFRIFNPILQGKRFDPDGDYVKKWVPELKNVDPKYIHEPFNAPPMELIEQGVKLGKTYPCPIVNHSKERDVAMNKYEKIKVS